MMLPEIFSNPGAIAAMCDPRIFLAMAVFMLFAFSCITDIRSLMIPNWVSLAIIALGAGRLFLTPDVMDILWWDIGIFALTCVLGIAFYTLGWFGGGDIKIVMAASLWFGWSDMASFMLALLVMGFFLALWVMVFTRLKERFPNNTAIGVMAMHELHLPYGVAIGLGAVPVLIDQIMRWGGAGCAV